MPEKLWKTIDNNLPRPRHLDADDYCAYARERIARARYDESLGNDLVNNFQKSVGKRDTGEWYWKCCAIKQFAQEVVQVLDDGMTVAFMPTSKIETDKMYDPRFDMLRDEMRKLMPKLVFAQPIIRNRSVPSLKSGERARVVHLAMQDLEYAGFDGDPPEGLVLIDDVITWGTTFKACQRILRAHHPEMELPGLFWTKTVWRDDEEIGVF